ncbi:protoporphyrin IX magnesium chelatase [Thermoplasma volcanium GSS1]|uniref:Protoporphyrin IX magnesium chelatase n=1 Tax=Thermoplasma volcanium (strain ATCC 51530 / DSM 4299 / JCM 9571 / NBRC 15438 / GSS1) TaxID=273116 RepID=Q97B30_THEVO|nr:ATP-binding protein [Thermoplasma volcanium]BAB59771.1 protoporphyrin IX magnesium chelatase [Thermoplasma volcanium GSS1]
MDRLLFPFSAVVGEDDLKEALLINAVNPRIGGVLIRGPKGVAKSTIARSLIDILPEIDVVKDCPFKCDPDDYESMCDECRIKYEKGQIVRDRRKMPFVDLPVSATIDRVIGSIDISKAVNEGIKALQPGLLADANRGIIYIDEVNLLDDSVIDAILDAAASGINVVEREGVSIVHPAKFILIGTMNPEEGDLRPQLRDRFGLSVDAVQPDSPDELITISDRVEEYDANPRAFAEKYRRDQEKLRASVIEARRILPEVTISNDLKRYIANVVIKLNAGNRAMITAIKASKAIAALAGRKKVNIEDVERALYLTLKHRVQDKSMIKGTIEKESRFLKTASYEAGSESGKENSPSPNGNNRDKPQPSENEVLERRVSASFNESGSTSGRAGVADIIRNLDYNRTGTVFNAYETLVKMALNHDNRIKPEDVVMTKATSRSSLPVILALDASRSMETMKRIAIARGIARDFLKSAYRMRVKMSYLTFSGSDTAVRVEMTRDIGRIEEEIMHTVAKGKTPLPSALKKMYEISSRYRKRTVSILITDGRANVPINRSVEEDLRYWSKKLGLKSDLFLISSTMGSEQFIPTYNNDICSYSRGRLIELNSNGDLSIHSGYRKF